jgi:transcriptional regulator with XRE-family HTH domain
VKKKPENFTKKLTRKTKSPASMLRALREREGLSQREMAEKIKTVQTYISAMEIEKVPISLNMAKRIAKKFKMDIGLFYKERK